MVSQRMMSAEEDVLEDLGELDSWEEVEASLLLAASREHEISSCLGGQQSPAHVVQHLDIAEANAKIHNCQAQVGTCFCMSFFQFEFRSNRLLLQDSDADSSDLAQASDCVQSDPAESTWWTSLAHQVPLSPDLVPLSPEFDNLISCAASSPLQNSLDLCCQGMEPPPASSMIGSSSQVQPNVQQHSTGQHQGQVYPCSSTQQPETRGRLPASSSRQGGVSVGANSAAPPVSDGAASASSAAMVRSLIISLGFTSSQLYSEIFSLPKRQARLDQAILQTLQNM